MTKTPQNHSTPGVPVEPVNQVGSSPSAVPGGLSFRESVISGAQELRLNEMALRAYEKAAYVASQTGIELPTLSADEQVAAIGLAHGKPVTTLADSAVVYKLTELNPEQYQAFMGFLAHGYLLVAAEAAGQQRKEQETKSQS
jgi:hypothetical protein